MDKPDSETQIAIIQTDIGYIKESLNSINLDIKEFKGAYVPYQQFVDQLQRQREFNDSFKRDYLTVQEFLPFKRILIFIASGLGVGFIGLIYQLITNYLIK